MKKFILYGLSLTVLLCAAPLSSYSLAAEPQTEKVVIEGYFVMKGNTPFNRLIFQSADGINYEVTSAEMKKFSMLQGQKKIIQASVQVSELVTVDKKIRRKVYIIKNIKLLSRHEKNK